jgi:hypothetical protein
MMPRLCVIHAWLSTTIQNLPDILSAEGIGIASFIVWWIKTIAILIDIFEVFRAVSAGIVGAFVDHGTAKNVNAVFLVGNGSKWQGTKGKDEGYGEQRMSKFQADHTVSLQTKNVRLDCQDIVPCIVSEEHFL